MNTSFFVLQKKSWLPLSSAIVLTCAALTMNAASSRAELLIAGFESAEGFTAGQAASGSGGWSTGNNNYLIVDDYAYSGTQSLRVTAGNTSHLDSPILVDQGFTNLSLKLSNPDTAFAAFDPFAKFRISVGAVGGTGPQATLRFSLAYSGADDSKYRLSYDDSGVSKVVYFTNSQFDPKSWSDFHFELNSLAQTYSVSIGGAPVVANIALGGTADAGSGIYQIQFWGQSATQGGNVYYDAITAVPEPSSVTWLGAGIAAAFAVLARRKKAVI